MFHVIFQTNNQDSYVVRDFPPPPPGSHLDITDRLLGSQTSMKCENGGVQTPR